MVQSPSDAKLALTQIASKDPDGTIARDLKARLDAWLTESVIYVARELDGREVIGRRDWSTMMNQRFELPDVRLTVNLLKKLAENYFARLQLTEDEFKGLGFTAAVNSLPTLERMGNSDAELLRARDAIRKFIQNEKFKVLEQTSGVSSPDDTRLSKLGGTDAVEPTAEEARQWILASLSKPDPSRTGAELATSSNRLRRFPLAVATTAPVRRARIKYAADGAAGMRQNRTDRPARCRDRPAHCCHEFWGDV